MKASYSKFRSQQGFTLFEVMLTMTILLSLTSAAVMAIRNSLDIRERIGEKTLVSHRLNVVMQKLVRDLEHTYIISTLAVWSNPVSRATKTIFETENDGTLRLTTMSRTPVMANAHRSDQVMVVYQLRDDKDHPGFKVLYRGESANAPEDLEEDLPMEKLATGVAKFEITPWSGQKWDDGKWSTNKSEHRNMLPRMVKINLEIIDIDPEYAFEKAAEELPRTQMSTVVYLQRSWGLKEYKEFSGSLKWL